MNDLETQFAKLEFLAGSAEGMEAFNTIYESLLMDVKGIEDRAARYQNALRLKGLQVRQGLFLVKLTGPDPGPGRIEND